MDYINKTHVFVDNLFRLYFFYIIMYERVRKINDLVKEYGKMFYISGSQRRKLGGPLF